MCNLPRLPLRTKLCAIVCVASFLLAPTGGAIPQNEEQTEPAKITAIRFWSLGDATRIVIESTGDFQFRSDRLDNPDRIFFDLIGVHPRLGGTVRGRNVISVGDGFVRQIRIAETQHAVTRVVLDLASKVEFVTSQLANPDRLIIELHSAGWNITEKQDGKTDSALERVARNARTPVLIDPPPPLDAVAIYAALPFSKPDPLAAAGLGRVGPLPPTIARAGKTSRSSRLSHEASREKEPELPSTREAGLPAKRTGAGETLTRVLGLKLQRIVLDAGHGGHDTGTIGPGDVYEKDIALDVAKRLGTLLQSRLGSEVIYTRSDDTFIPLSRRTEIANEAKADLFLSIHVNSSPARAASGMETYYLNFTTSKEALETATRENAGADRSIGELQDLVKQIALKDKVDESREFASRIQNALSSLEPKSARGSRDRGVKRAPFVVLIGAFMPSVLAEVGFITNPREEAMMRKPEYRQKLAEALYKGLSSYANSLSHFQVAQHSEKTAKAYSNPE